jgi:hypothetical protein
MACQSIPSPEVTFAAGCIELFLPVAVPSQRPLGRSPSARQPPCGVRHRALSGGLWIPRAFRLPAFASCAFLRPLWSWPTLAMGLLAPARPQRGYHVPHRQETSGELASLRREPGTLSREPLISPDPHSDEDSHRHTRPLLHYDASTKASQLFNSTPTFPRRDFDCGCLLSLCFYDLLETPWLPTTPRSYGNGPLVLAQSDSTSFQSQTLDLCDLVSH